MTTTILETWPQFVANTQRCKPKGRLSPENRIENIRQFHKAFATWNERMEWLSNWEKQPDITPDDVSKMKQIIRRKYLLDVRELFPQRHEHIEKRLRQMPKFAVSVMGALH